MSSTSGVLHSTTTVSSTPNPSVTGQDVTFTTTVAAVAPGSGTPTGTVTFLVKDNTHTTVETSDITLDGSGQATHTTDVMMASGSPYSVTAVYAGVSNYSGSNNSASPYSQTVNKADTSIAITSDNPDPSFEGESYTVTWTVSVTGPGSDTPATPAGTVTVIDQTGATSGAVAVATGTCSLTSTIDGAKTLKATYSGDVNYETSNTTESHTVNSNGTSISVNSSPNPSIVTGQVELTATLTPDSSGGPDATGTVTFKEGGTPIGSDTDGSDGWSLLYTFTTAGSRNITAAR